MGASTGSSSATVRRRQPDRTTGGRQRHLLQPESPASRASQLGEHGTVPASTLSLKQDVIELQDQILELQAARQALLVAMGAKRQAQKS